MEFLFFYSVDVKSCLNLNIIVVSIARSKSTFLSIPELYTRHTLRNQFAVSLIPYGAIHNK